MKRGVSNSFNSNSDIEEIIGIKNYTNYLAEYGKIEDSFFIMI